MRGEGKKERGEGRGGGREEGERRRGREEREEGEEKLKLTSPSLQSNYKDRIRFEYGLIVPEALHDGKPEVARLEAKLAALLGRALPLIVDTTWTEHPHFRNLEHKTQ
jgi:hypothetical protein